MSVRQRLMVAMCSTLALGILGLGSIARWEARSEAVASSTERLETVSRQTADLLASSLTGQRTQALSVARDNNTRILASGRAGVERDSAVARLVRADSNSAAIVSIELWDSLGTVLFATQDDYRTVRDSVRRLLLGRLATGDSAATGRLITHGDFIAYATIARIDRSDSDRFAVLWRRLVSTETETNALLELLGTNSRLVVGNQRGVIWSDLRQRSMAPPASASDSVVQYTREDGVDVLVRRAAIRGSTWDVAVEFPMSDVLAPADRLTRALGIAGVLVLFVGAFIAWWLARSFARPIAQLVDAAGAMRQGDYQRRTPDERRDEFGDLARAFNTMADAIAEGRVRQQAHAEDLQRRGDALAAQSQQTEEANAQLRTAIQDAERSRRSLQTALNENARTAAELNAALAGAPVAFGFHDTSMRYVRINDRLAGFIGKPASEIIGRLPSEVLPGIGPNVELGLARALESGKPVLDIELPASRVGHSGPERQWLATLFPIRTEASVIGLGSVMLDMTEYKLLEQRFLHAQRMEAVGRLAGGIAHDFNNILTAIGSFNEFAIKELTPEHPAVEDLEQVNMAVTRATGLIRQLLSFSRHQAMQPVVLDLSEVVGNLMPMLRRLIPENVQLRHDLRDDVGPVLADPVRIEQILVNLVVNAADAMPEGGRLAITTHSTVVENDPKSTARLTPGRYAVLSVTDSGVGMDADTKARAFEPFFTTKALGRGTGLGLSTVHGIVKQSNGAIRIDSTPGSGTTITILLPHHDAPAPARTAVTPRQTPAHGKATILLVEDELLVRLAIRRILTSQGHQVVEATDGEAALSVLSRLGSPVDLIISDLVMPRLGGRELGERIRAKGHSARILFMSGYTGEFATRQSLLDASAEFIEKPFSPEALLLKVDELLAMPAVRTPSA